MRKILLLIILLIGLTTTGYSQSFIGFLTDNYSGVHGVINNPASIVDSKYKIDVNLAGASALVGNDFIGFDPLLLRDANYSLEDDAIRFPLDENNLFGNIDVLGPSVLLNINEESSIAFFTRARLFYNVENIDGSSVNIADNGFDNNESFFINQNNTFISTNTWAEIGVSYASILVNENQHFVKGGFTFKYLKGLGNAYVTSNQVNINYDPSEIVTGANSAGEVETSGDFTYGYSDNFKDNAKDIGPVSGAGALGLDFGLIYEWRHNRLSDNYTGYNKYKLKFGLSVTDVGSITYNNIQESFNIDNAISQEDFETINSPSEIRNLYSVQTTGQTEKAILPTALHVNADWNINQKFYLNLNTDLSLTKKDAVNRSYVANMLTITPRFESKWFTVQTPISLQQYSGLQLGAGFRAGPLYVGSGSLISGLFNKESKSVDIYAGIKIPIFKKISKDRDQDGVPDKIDKCKDEFGDKDNNGCPWEDTDGDGLTDNLDDCPEIPGDKENKGCPKLTYEIQEELNSLAKVVLFNTNRTEIDENTANALADIMNILYKYPNAKLSIEGHADSIGKSSHNQKVSELRANAVRNYLISKGIEPSRLEAVGYGENRPISTNLTRKGRTENRRVEIKLILD